MEGIPLTTQISQWALTSLAKVDPSGTTTRAILGANLGETPHVPTPLATIAHYPQYGQNFLTPSLTAAHTFFISEAFVAFNIAGKMALKGFEGLPDRASRELKFGVAVAAEEDAKMALNRNLRYRELFSRTQAGTLYLSAGCDMLADTGSTDIYTLCKKEMDPLLRPYPQNSRQGYLAHQEQNRSMGHISRPSVFRFDTEHQSIPHLSTRC